MSLHAPRERRAAIVFVLAAGLAALVAAAGTTREDEDEGLAERHAEFLEQVHFLMHPDEREVWEQLDKDYQRDAFIRRFWRERDQRPETARNEYREAFEQNVLAAKERFSDLKTDRARLILAHGRPTRTFQIHCEVLRSLDIWYYHRSPLFAGEFFAVFARRGSDYRLWSQSDGLFPLMQFTASIDDQDKVQEIERNCNRSDDILKALALSPDWRDLDDDLFPAAGGEWARSFLASSTTLPSDATTLDAAVSVDYVGRHQSRTVVEARIDVGSDDVAVDTVEERPDRALPGRRRSASRR